ncbi:MAG: hypothetical protein KGY50_04385 [Candidatus Thermoplasmatota archaeon]|nr:hypothetical protein [Candidatus Thermoplasmatota archaeon]
MVLFSQFVFVSIAQGSGLVFDYVSSSNIVNKIDQDVVFTCVFSPSISPKNVTVHISFPGSNCSEFDMVKMETGKFVNTTSFSTIGSYSFFIRATVDNETVTSISRSFWISTSLLDRDNDGMNDVWEQFYGFDPTDPSDAYEDYDGDGYNNLEEFRLGTNPLDADYFEFVMVYIDSHFQLIFLTLLFLLIALFCSLLGMRRSTKWI